MNAWGRGVVRGVKGEQFPVAESPWGREITAWGAEKAQQCRKYFLQYSQFASENLKFEHRGDKL